MSIQRRFYCPEARAIGDVVRLPDEEAQHLTRVLRLGAGDEVSLFDGTGHAFAATVETALRNSVTVRIGSRIDAAPEPAVSILLAQAILKGDKMDDVVRDAVMLGVTAMQPIVTARTEISLGAVERGRRQERWQRIAISSAKQCGRAVVPAIHPAATFETLLARVRDLTVPATTLLFTEPSAAGEAVPIGELDLPRPTEVTVVIGPEGGWGEAELAQADLCRFVTLGRRTLRADATPLVALSALFTLWGEF